MAPFSTEWGTTVSGGGGGGGEELESRTSVDDVSWDPLGFYGALGTDRVAVTGRGEGIATFASQ